jgi:hypothetical protein
MPFRAFPMPFNRASDSLLTGLLSARVKLPSRRSLAHIGIPNHRDALAVYFRWVRQRYYRAHAVMEYEAAPSAVSTDISYSVLDVYDERDFVTSAMDIQFDAERLRVDLLSVGAMFEGAAVGTAYPCEIVLE